MDKVYIVFAGEQYDSKDLVSVHRSVHEARDGAESYIHKDAILKGSAYKPDHGGLSWVAKSGHYVVIEAHPVA
jgi:hypothetical protein